MSSVQTPFAHAQHNDVGPYNIPHENEWCGHDRGPEFDASTKSLTCLTGCRLLSLLSLIRSPLAAVNFLYAPHCVVIPLQHWV